MEQLGTREDGLVSQYVKANAKATSLRTRGESDGDPESGY